MALQTRLKEAARGWPPPVPQESLDARWAADALANLARRLPGDSMTSVVLRRCQQELLSLSSSLIEIAELEPVVIGPLRVRRAA